MIPTLLVGDFILVNKFTYGIRIPIVNKKVIEIGTPERGDVMVFRYPEDPAVDYIKRVIGLPGDKIVYSGKRVWINGTELELKNDGEYLHKRATYARQYIETDRQSFASDPGRGRCAGHRSLREAIPVPRELLLQ